MSLRFIISVVFYNCFLTVFSQNSDFLIQEYHQNISISKSGLKEEKSYLFRINNKSDNWIGEIAIYHSPSEKFKLVEAVLLDKNMVETRKIKSKDIHTEHAGSDISFFDDGLIDVFSLIHNEYPYFIRYSYTSESDNFLFVDNWSPIIDSKTGTALATLTVNHPADYPILVDTTGIFEYQNSQNGLLVSEKWTKKWTSPPKQEPFSPAFKELIDHVTIVPRDFYYGHNGSHTSWQSFGDWAYQFTVGKDQLSTAKSAFIQEKFGQFTDTLSLIKDLYYYLQDHNRYISVNIGIGGFEPYSADYVSDNKFGDCKALTMYMKALLNVFEIPSYYTKVYADENPVKINADFPSQQFNHVFLTVPLGKDTIWLENTSNNLPFNYMGTFTQNRKLLLAKPGGSQLIDAPVLKDNLTRTFVYLSLENEELKGQVNIHVHNAPYEDFAYILKNLNTTDRQKYFQKYVEKLSLNLGTYEASLINRDSADAQLTGEISASQLLRKIGHQTVIKLPPNRLPSISSFKNRINPIRFNYPETFIEEIHLKIADQKMQLLASCEINSDFGTYACSISQNENEIIITRKYNLYAGEYSAKSSEAIIGWLKAIEKYENNNPVLLN